MDVMSMLNVQLVLIVCMAVGFVAGKLNIINDSGRDQLTDIIMKIALPGSIIASFIQTGFSPELMEQSITVLLLELVIQLSMIPMGYALFPKKYFTEDERKALRYSLINSNAAFIGIPVLSGVLGELGEMLGAIAMIPKRVMLWTAGLSIYVVDNDIKKKIKKIALHPSIVSVYIGIICMLLPVNYPTFVLSSLKTVGSSTTFLAMFLVGYLVSRMKTFKVISGKVMYYTFVRLLLIPCAVLGILKLCGFDAVVIAICVILSGVPAGSYTALMAAKYNGDTEFASKIVLVSTLLSIVSLPLICLFI